MIAPSGGFWPAGSSGGSGVSVFMFQRTRRARCGLKSTRRRPWRGLVDLPQRRDVVQDPEAAAMRPDDQVVVLDDEVADRRGRQVQPQRLPVVAVVERDIHRALGAGEQQALALRIFATTFTVSPSGMPLVMCVQVFAAVVGAEDMRPQVVEPERVDRRVGAERVGVRRVHERHLRPWRQLGRRDILPGVPAVAVTWIRPSSVPAQMRLMSM